MDLNEARFKLNKDIPIPLYYQVKRMVLNEIANGNLKLGDKLPAEIEFCESLQISRPTVRLALNELAPLWPNLKSPWKSTRVWKTSSA